MVLSAPAAASKLAPGSAGFTRGPSGGVGSAQRSWAWLGVGTGPTIGLGVGV